MKSSLLKAVCAFGLVAMVLSACGPKPVPGEKDREQAQQALDQMPK